MANPNDPQGPNQFDVARQRAAQQNASGLQSQQDALKRRFAAAGALNSGAAIKQGELVNQAAEQNLNQANEGINAQEQQQKYVENQAQKQRDFQTGERLGGQQFAAEQAGLGREFQAGQAQYGRDFAHNERLGEQQFSAQQAGLGRDFQASQADLQRQLQGSQFDRQLGLAYEQFGEDKNVNAQNAKFAQQMLDQKDFFEKALSGDIVNQQLSTAQKWVGSIPGVNAVTGTLNKYF